MNRIKLFQRVLFSTETLPVKPTLHITNTCYERIRYLNQSKPNQLALRVSVESGGCSGFQYKMLLENPQPTAHDLFVYYNCDELFGSVFEENGAKVIVDDLSMDYIKGATIDYVDELIRNSFVVASNPNSESTCGCKTSFALKS